MEFFRNLGYVIVMAVYMAVYYFVMVVIGGLLVTLLLMMVDAFCNTKFTTRWRRWLAGMEAWRQEQFSRNADNSEKPEPDKVWKSA